MYHVFQSINTFTSRGSKDSKIILPKLSGGVRSGAFPVDVLGFELKLGENKRYFKEVYCI